MTRTALVATLLTVSVATTPGQTSRPIERFVAFGVNTGGAWSSGTATTVEIAIERWSTDDETDQLLIALREQGPDKLLDALRAMPRVGFIRTPGNLGYDLHYARREAADEGGERIVIATDRPIALWEAVNRPRTMDYPFTVIEMRLDREGHGEGKLSIATKISIDRRGKTIELENYDTQPVRLQSIRRESSQR